MCHLVICQLLYSINIGPLWGFMRKLLASYIVMTTWLTADHNKSETTQFNQFNTFIKNKSLKYKEN